MSVEQRGPIDKGLKRIYLAHGLTEQQTQQLADNQLGTWQAIETYVKEGELLGRLTDAIGIKPDDAKTVNSLLHRICTKPGVRPTVLLSSALPDAALPSSIEKPSGSQKIKHTGPAGCERWNTVAPQERFAALLSRLAAASGSDATAGDFTAVAGAGCGTTSIAVGGGGGGGSSSGGGSGGGGNGGGGGGGSGTSSEGGDSSFDGQLLALIRRADEVFCSADGEPKRALLEQQGSPTVLINEAIAVRSTWQLLRALEVLVNALLKRLRGSGQQHLASADHTPAAAAAAAVVVGCEAAAGAKPLAAAGITPGAEPPAACSRGAAAKEGLAAGTDSATKGAAAAVAGSDSGAAAPPPAAAPARTGRPISVHWGAEIGVGKLRAGAGSQEVHAWLGKKEAGDSLRPDTPLIAIMLADDDDDAAHEQQPWQQCSSFVEMKAPGLLLEADGTPRSLVDLWRSRDEGVRAMLAQVNAYMGCLGLTYAIISCHYALWPVRRTCSPPPPPPLQVPLENQPQHPQQQQQQQQQQVPAAAADAGARTSDGSVRMTRSASAASAAAAAADAARAQAAAGTGGDGCGGPPEGVSGGGDGGGSAAASGGGGGRSGKRSRSSCGGDGSVLHVAGPFLAPTAHTDQQPAATAASATLYTMMLSLAPGAAGRARRRPPGQPDAGASSSSGGGGDGGGAVGRGGQPGGAAAGGAAHTGGQAVGGAGLAAHGSRAATSPPAGAGRRAAAGGEAEAQPSMLQRQRDEQGAVSRPALAPASPSEARGGDGASLAPVTGSSAHHWRRRACCLRQPPPLPPLLIEADPEVLHVGYAGLTCTGRVNGEEAVLKILDSDEHGGGTYEAELAAYRALAPLQGDVLPRLLAAGRIGDLEPPPPAPPPPSGQEAEEEEAEEEEEWEPPPDADVRFIATSRVRGLTLRQAAEQWGYIQPTVAAAAVRALRALHAADIRAAGGGSGGRFLHGDIRLSNFMLLLPAAEAAVAEAGVGPRCVVIDLGLSRLDGTEAEQQAEVRQLEQRLQCGSG